MKYRLLSKEELEELKPEFIQFLVSNTITADEWERLKKSDSEKVAEILELFSDIVLEKVLKKITFIEYREKNSLMAFYCMEDKMSLLGLNIEGDADLTDNSFIEEVNKNPAILNKLKIQIFKTIKPYKQERELEIFQLLQTGALVSSGDMYRLLETLKISNN